MQLNITTGTIFLVLKLLVGMFTTIGFVLITLEVFGFPLSQAKKNISYLSKRATVQNSLLSDIVGHLSKILIKFVKIGDFKRKRLVSQFENLGIKMTPEEYYSEMFAKILLLVLLIPIGFIIHIALGVLFAIIAVLFGLLEYNKLDEIIRKKKEAIEIELPKFVSVIEQTFKNDHDVIKLISTYVENEDSPLVNELNIALADMKTGDFETALTRLANRVNSVPLSEVVRGLQSALHGDDTVGYFASLNSKLWESEKIRIRKKALKTPSKVKYLVKVLLCCMFLIYVTVFGTVIYDGLHEIFSLM